MLELEKSKSYLDQLTNERVIYIAYPFGTSHDFNQARIEGVKKAGYKAGFSAISNPLTGSLDLYALPRIAIARTCGNFTSGLQVRFH